MMALFKIFCYINTIYNFISPQILYFFNKKEDCLINNLLKIYCSKHFTFTGSISLLRNRDISFPKWETLIFPTCGGMILYLESFTFPRFGEH